MVMTARTLTGHEYPERPWPAPGTTQKAEPLPPIPAQLVPVVSKLHELLDLREGWNSYGARRIDPGAVVAALRILAQANWLGPLPNVAPTPRGGVELEWGGDDDGVEIECRPDGSMTVLVDVHGQMREWAVAGPDDPNLTEAFIWADKLG
jgi:hypothetical protein